MPQIDSFQWDLHSCCGTPEIIFLCLYAGYGVITMLFGHWKLFKAMRLLAVFIHEMSHAIACWLTCGSVKKIEVYNNEGGVTGYTGGTIRILSSRLLPPRAHKDR